MTSLKKSLFFSVGEKYLLFGIQFISSIIIARLLSPTELGIFSIGSLILSFSHVFRDLGISNYIIQEKNLTEERLRTAQTLLFASSWFLALVAWAASPWLASFYAQPGVRTVVLVLSLNFLILPFGSLAAALLKREMLFDRVFKISTTAALIHTTVAVGLCLAGFGPLSLAWAGVAGTVSTILLTVHYSPHKIGLTPSLADWRHVFGTGGRYSAVSLLWETGVSGPELIVGKVMGVENAGFLGRAQGVVGLAYRSIMEGLIPVLMPHFANSHREHADVGSQFLKTIDSVSAVTFPMFCCLIVAMESIVTLLYGNQWQASIEPARIICVGMLVLSVTVVAGSAVAGMGEAKYSLRFQLLGQPVRLTLVVLGCHFSLQHVAAAMAFGDILIATYVTLVLKKLTNFHWRNFLYCMVKSAFISTIAAGACFSFKTLAVDQGEFTIVFGSILSSIMGWLIGLYTIHHPLANELSELANKIRKN